MAACRPNNLTIINNLKIIREDTRAIYVFFASLTQTGALAWNVKTTRRMCDDHRSPFASSV